MPVTSDLQAIEQKIEEISTTYKELNDYKDILLVWANAAMEEWQIELEIGLCYIEKQRIFLNRIQLTRNSPLWIFDYNSIDKWAKEYMSCVGNKLPHRSLIWCLRTMAVIIGRDILSK